MSMEESRIMMYNKGNDIKTKINYLIKMRKNSFGINILIFLGEIYGK